MGVYSGVPKSNMRGMAGALALLKGTKDLERKEDLIGRTKDKRDAADRQNEMSVTDAGYGGTNKEIKIEYRDEFGRALTKKEAFRQLCYDFHGYGPSKRKREKRENQRADKEKVLSSSSNGLDNTTGTLKSFTKAQEATGRAYISIGKGAVSNSATATLAKEMAKKKAAKEAQKLKKRES